MIRKLLTTLTTTVDGAGVLVALNDTENILNIILLILSILGILVTAGFNIYDHIKNKDAKGVVEDINQAKEDIEKLKKEDE